MEKDKKEFVDYLTSVKSAVAGNGLDKYSIIHMIVGNEACDLDSAVSTVVYAFHLTRISRGTPTEHATILIPVLNIPEDDYSLKTEVVHVLRRSAGVGRDHLIFADQLDVVGLSQGHRLRITLVDHHVPVGSFAGLAPLVCDVIDHHTLTPGKDTNFIRKLNTTIEPVGSCATLIGEKVLAGPSSSQPIPPPPVNSVLVTLLRQTIILDTVNFSPSAQKATAKDRAVITALEKADGCSSVSTQSRDDVFAELIRAKSDISQLSTDQLLRKDVKMLRLNDVQVAVSSIPLLVKDYFCSSERQQELADRCRSESIDATVVLGVSLTGDVSRDLLIFSSNQLYLEKITIGLQTCTAPCLRLEQSATFSPLNHHYRYFHQATTSASRKQILPVLADTLQQNGPPALRLPDGEPPVLQRTTSSRKPSGSSEIPETATPPNSFINGHGFLTDQHSVFTGVQRRIQQLDGRGGRGGQSYASQTSHDYAITTPDYATATPSNTFVDDAGRNLLLRDCGTRLAERDTEELQDRMAALKLHREEENPECESPYGELVEEGEQEDGGGVVFDMEDDESPRGVVLGRK